ncbi:assembly factor CBP4 [Helicocarpus griseus UAMH5409]|uniref:Cytochrome b mRNA-processing protein 4 n=1 Tax=Helicocarpus griseus UAMH5409 TaxID=1447875 RepID=A0A2B7WFL6_9EURO|nr:assembly factor CBP4 [Helicocarpus griseus UAMH5409]
MPRLGTSLKMLGIGGVLCIGGPALVQYLRPSEEELFKRFNPELQKRNIETREKRQQDFDTFVTQLKTHAKSDKSIWQAMKESEATNKRQATQQRKAETEEVAKQKEQIKKELEEGL